MPQSLKSLLTMAVLLGLLVGGAVWGWTAFTEPLPTTEEPPVCEDTTVAAGSKLIPDQVTISVYNASTRAGLASRTMGLLTSQGFGQGQMGNAPAGTDVAVAEVWADDVNSPAALLVRTYLGKRVEIQQRASLGPGVTVIVGPDFEALAKGKPAVKVAQDATICSPPS